MNRTNAWLLMLMLGLVAGCNQTSEDEAGHDHDHAHDHFVPVHWPSDIADIATKIEIRKIALGADGVSSEKRRRVLKKELIDVVGWAPEIAADSYLKESEWVPIYNESLKLSQRLNRIGLVLDEGAVAEVERFSKLIRESAIIEAANRPAKIGEANEVSEDAEAASDEGTRS